MSIEQDLRQYISEQIVLDAGEAGVGEDEPLLSSGRVDSLGLLQILSYIDERYGVALMDRGSPHDCESVKALAAAIRWATNG